MTTNVADELAGTHYSLTEVVGVFSTETALEQAVGELGLAGVDRAAISVRDIEPAPSQGVMPLRSAQAAIRDPGARQSAFMSRGTRIEGNAVAISVPLMIGAFATAWLATAYHGSLSVAIGAAILGGAIGAACGFRLYRVIQRRHTDGLQRQLATGGFALWVKTPDKPAEKSASDVLRRCGATSVSSMASKRDWGPKDTPLHDVHPDPFLN